MIEKIRIIFISLFFIFSLGLKEVLAYEYPTIDYYAVVDESTFGEITIHIPSNQIDLLQIQETDSNIINISSGSVYGYFTSNGTDYRVTFPTFDNPTYRNTSGSSYNTYDLNILSIVDTNISHFRSDEQKTPMDYMKEFADDTYILITLLCIFGIGVLIWLKH